MNGRSASRETAFRSSISNFQVSTSVLMAAQPQAVQDVREDLRQQLIDDVRTGLSARPKTLPARWFYDSRGSELFEAITELPEYYLTRTETDILRRQADEIRGHDPARGAGGARVGHMHEGRGCSSTQLAAGVRSGLSFPSTSTRT